MNLKKSTILPWQKFAKNWQRITSPDRPTQTEIRFYENFAKKILKKKKSRVLVLGATPELRDMLAKYKNAEVVLVDINLDMILAMSSLMRNKKAKEKEIWIKANWLEAPLPKNYFDIVYGDFVLSNVPLKYQDKFLANIKNWLKPIGYFIMRCESYKPHYKPFSISEIFDFFKDKLVNRQTINLFWEIGVWLTGRFDKDREIRPIVFYRNLKKYLKTHPHPKISRILKKGGILYPLNGTWYTHTLEGLKKLILKYFEILDSKFDPKINFVYPDIAPVYKLKPKKS